MILSLKIHQELILWSYTPKGGEKPPERVIIHKGHIVLIIPLEENKNSEKKDKITIFQYFFTLLLLMINLY